MLCVEFETAGVLLPLIVLHVGVPDHTHASAARALVFNSARHFAFENSMHAPRANPKFTVSSRKHALHKHLQPETQPATCRDSRVSGIPMRCASGELRGLGIQEGFRKQSPKTRKPHWDLGWGKSPEARTTKMAL